MLNPKVFLPVRFTSLSLSSLDMGLNLITFRNCPAHWGLKQPPDQLTTPLLY